ncbi:hypothetical protein HG536_0E02050 [Torulaspora globosa]|uniref:mRNA transport regulator MTR2 n=1 Tax=Torulaspora globosa TaxID=48254 RepID=A0A7G3ZIF8_9SACH|nr:uncharacterized protein HG536_0E02050 [Torulaspora globosa]QLL33294.1 hypothetical protein HG536_0E02050 [Torulaspora globosa]
MSRYGGGNISNASGGNRSQIAELFVKKILAHLDDTDPQKLNQFLNLFNSNNCKVVFNATPFAQLPLFLQMWQNQIVQTQHALTAVDYHVIPGSQTVIFNVNCKVRFDESGKDKMGQDATVSPGEQKLQHQKHRPANRPLWGTYFGVSLQLVVEERLFSNDMNGVILAFNYNMIYKPDDSLITVN